MEIDMRRRSGKRTRQKTLAGVFLRYISAYTIGALFLMLAVFLVYCALTVTGEVLPANYMEAELNASADEIKKAPRVTEELLPRGCVYGVYEYDGTWLYGTFSQEERKQAWENYEVNRIYASGEGYYRFFMRGAREVCIAKYQIAAQFRNDFLRKLLPKPDILMMIAFAALFLLQTLLVSRHFGKYMQARLRILYEMTEKIKNQDLEFEEERSQLKEVDEVLGSLHQMKEALKSSLYRQWNLEQSKNEQIAALAHDIKTPLTIIRGNAELMAEGELTEDEKEYNRDILMSVSAMEEYLTILNELLMPEERAAGEREESAGDKGREENDIAKGGRAGGMVKESKRLGRDDMNGGSKIAGRGGRYKERDNYPEGNTGREKSAGQSSAEMVISCVELADHLTEQTRLLASARQYTIVFCRKELQGMIRCNISQIQRAWNNILGNAMDYSPQDGEIVIGFKLEEKEGREYLAASVADEGPGFSKQELMHATEQFYQGDQSRSSRTHYGIGLHTADRFVREQGGYLTLENEEGNGAKVTICIRIGE